MYYIHDELPPHKTNAMPVVHYLDQSYQNNVAWKQVITHTTCTSSLWQKDRMTSH